MREELRIDRIGRDRDNQLSNADTEDKAAYYLPRYTIPKPSPSGHTFYSKEAVYEHLI